MRVVVDDVVAALLAAYQQSPQEHFGRDSRQLKAQRDDDARLHRQQFGL